jgi:predicted TIM-barrel fold metal-dependent hydrolase
MTTYYSCDSHVVEPPEVFAGLDERFGERAPRIVRDPDGRKGTFIQRGARLQAVGRLGIAGRRLDDPETHRRIERGYEGFEPGILDPIARLDDQATDGIAGEVLYPSLNISTFAMPDREVVHALFRRHNDWLSDYCSAAPERLIGAACLPLPDVEESVAELERVARLGFRAVTIPCAVPVDRPYSDPAYEPFWRAAEEAGLPVSMHVFCGAVPNMGLPAHWNTIQSYALAHTAIGITVTQLICGGVAARHPDLRFVCAEFETGWLAHFLRRLDHAAYRAPNEASPDMTLKPTEYFRRQFYATFEDDAIGVQTRHGIGVDNLIWGNDYPHHDAIWPNSRAILDRIFQGVPEDEKAKMVGANGMALYRVKLPAEVGARAAGGG